jgi:hypothetical protein
MSRTRGGRADDAGPEHDPGHQRRHEVRRGVFTPERYFMQNSEPAQGSWESRIRAEAEPVSSVRPFHYPRKPRA